MTFWNMELFNVTDALIKLNIPVLQLVKLQENKKKMAPKTS